MNHALGRQSRSARLQVRASGSTYGTMFRVTTFGESHGKGVGCIVDGVPPRLRISEAEIQVRNGQELPGMASPEWPGIFFPGGNGQAKAWTEHHHDAS